MGLFRIVLGADIVNVSDTLSLDDGAEFTLQAQGDVVYLHEGDSDPDKESIFVQLIPPWPYQASGELMGFTKKDGEHLYAYGPATLVIMESD